LFSSKLNIPPGFLILTWSFKGLGESDFIFTHMNHRMSSAIHTANIICYKHFNYNCFITFSK